MEKDNIIILHCPEIGCPPPLLQVFIEFSYSFIRKGYTCCISSSIQDINDKSIVLMGDFFHVENPGELLYNQSKNAIYIGWYWHKKNVSMLPYFLHIYENILSENVMVDKIEILKFMKSIPNSCPLLLRANDPIENIGRYIRNVNKDYCYMGYNYPICYQFIPGYPFKGIFHSVYDPTQYLDYNNRRNVYLTTMFALGIQSEENIINGHVSQRIFEGMAYGCVVLSNSIHASIQTDGIVEHFRSKTDLEERMKYFLENPDKIKEKQEKGYQFIREKGTNNYSLEIIENVVKNVYNISL